MLEHLRFARYALRFERAFKTDDWTRVAACFAPDARYVIEGTASEWDGETRGPAQIVAQFKRMLDQLDRKYDRRIPRLAGWPRVRAGELELRWGVRYVKGGTDTVLHGVSRCRFVGGKIVELRDTMNADECRAWVQLATGT